ncbi:MAG TPA: hypothetical protein VGD69_14895 [Herpetosiphonaceae bacterium]
MLAMLMMLAPAKNSPAIAPTTHDAVDDQGRIRESPLVSRDYIELAFISF